MKCFHQIVVQKMTIILYLCLREFGTPILLHIKYLGILKRPRPPVGFCWSRWYIEQSAAVPLLDNFQIL